MVHVFSVFDKRAVGNRLIFIYKTDNEILPSAVLLSFFVTNALNNKSEMEVIQLQNEKNSQLHCM